MAESFSNRLNVAMAFRNVKQIDFVHAAEKFNIKLGKSHMSQYVSGKNRAACRYRPFSCGFSAGQ